MEAAFGLCLVVGLLVTFCGSYEFDPDYMIPPKCKPCDAKSCPQLTYCAGTVVKDHCGCCPRCSSDLFQPHVPLRVPVPDPVSKPAQENACEARKCAKFKVCVINRQGLPICTCPSVYVCRPRGGKRSKYSKKDLKVCGTDGETYESRCHMRIANCNSSKRIRRLHPGKCLKTQTDAPPTEIGPATGNSKLQTPNPTMSLEDAKRMKAMERAKRKRMRRKKRKKKERRRKKGKERKERKNRQKRRRMKRRNNGYSVYSSRYGYLLGKHTTWGRSQVRKSRI